MKTSRLAIAISLVLGTSSATMPTASMSATLADGFYNMVIHNTPFTTGYQFGSDGAWGSSFTFGALPGAFSNALYDDTVATPVNGKYDGNVADGYQGTVAISVSGGVITGTGLFEFDMIPATAGGNFVEYGDSTLFTGTIDGGGNMTLTPTGVLGAVGGFPALVDERWNVNDFNGVTGTTPNPPNSNATWDTFTTGSATTSAGTINGAAFDGTTAILVKGGNVGSDWGGFFGAEYFEVWNVSFSLNNPPCCGPVVPIPATVWLFGAGLLGLVGVARRKKY